MTDRAGPSRCHILLDDIAGMPIVLATYNIHACIGADGEFDPDRIIAVIKELDADVLALQEVEHHKFDDLDLLDYLAAGSGYVAIAGPTLLRGSRDYGNALLTRLPVLSLNRLDLSMPGREPRGALDVVFDCNGQSLQVVATHLGLNPAERRQQARLLLSLFNPPAADISVLMGDLNEWFLWGRILRWLHAHFQATPGYATFPARWPLFALDHIWVHPRSRLSTLAVHTSTLARIASDHLPLKGILQTEQQ
ncbi:endonuclease/exonuclease/phosphatase family protein [Sulfuriflexus sp.]|uniref:endonuclease/exonuclease/phosphatase family protein n=1 Tax=Sulfuriflexus sp. TaxID=2015443 RepID=UPI0028CE6C2F|nr:endonuclease/exonuclease/phosphatase family protein [Sulfuriflexus sp.]MDT8405304.1 endonuclease/exonuclease/phosphatase family protein [Sulfuriflexus sp.]